MFITTKKPCYDQNGKFKGIIGFLSEINNETLTRITLSLMQLDKNQKRLAKYNSNTKVITDRYFSADLSEKETVVLYYILHGYSSREIGEITCRSKRTIESHIEKIKFKTGCSNKSDLIMYAISNGFLNMIPKSLVSADLNLSIQIHEAYWDAILK